MDQLLNEKGFFFLFIEDNVPLWQKVNVIFEWQLV